MSAACPRVCACHEDMSVDRAQIMAAAARPTFTEASVLEPFRALVVPPLGGVTGDNAASIQRAFNSKEILPISYGILHQASKEWQLKDAPGGQFLVLEHRPARVAPRGFSVSEARGDPYYLLSLTLK